MLPLHGALSISGSGFTYTPNADYNGTDSFVFLANDGQVNSPTATVNLTITSVPDIPVVMNDNVNVQMDVATNINVLVNDTDGDV